MTDFEQRFIERQSTFRFKAKMFFASIIPGGGYIVLIDEMVHALDDCQPKKPHLTLVKTDKP